MNLAFFSPLPPEKSGIAVYSSELLPCLLKDYNIDIYTEGGATADSLSGLPDALDAHNFVWKHAQNPYDLTIYQLGNAACHDYMWPYLTRYSGLVVLHDSQLHHARARALINDKRQDQYRREFQFNHKNADVTVAELGIQGILGDLTYLWPMVRLPVSAAKLVAVHNPLVSQKLQSTFPEQSFKTIHMGVPDPLLQAKDVTGQLTRKKFGIAPDDIIFTAIGGITPEKRVPQILRALATLKNTLPFRLVLVGNTASYYDPIADAQAHGIAERIIVTGYVNDTELADHLAAADVCFCMRWPSSNETSASWLRCLAAGKPTIITDLETLVHVPSLITRGTWTPSHLSPAQTDGQEAGQPIAVSIDLLDEDRSLAIATQRLAIDSSLRRRLGQRARNYWTVEHSMKRMTSDYRRTIESAAARAAPTLAANFNPDGTEQARKLLSSFGVLPDFLSAHNP